MQRPRFHVHAIRDAIPLKVISSDEPMVCSVKNLHGAPGMLQLGIYQIYSDMDIIGMTESLGEISFDDIVRLN